MTLRSRRTSGLVGIQQNVAFAREHCALQTKAMNVLVSARPLADDGGNLDYLFCFAAFRRRRIAAVAARPVPKSEIVRGSGTFSNAKFTFPGPALSAT